MTTIVVHISFSKLIYWLHQSYKKFMELWRFPFNISSQLILWLGSQVLDKWHFHKSTSLFRNCALWRSTTLFHCDLLHEIFTIFLWEIIQSILKIYPTSYSYHFNDTFVCLGILLLEGKSFSLQIHCGSLWVDLATIYALLFSPFEIKFHRKIVGLLVFKVFIWLFFSQSYELYKIVNYIEDSYIAKDCTILWNLWMTYVSSSCKTLQILCVSWCWLSFGHCFLFFLDCKESLHGDCELSLA